MIERGLVAASLRKLEGRDIPKRHESLVHALTTIQQFRSPK
jgi:hypothetical protein